MKRIFITGTGTDIGKTYVSALIVKKLHDSGLRTAYYKAAMSGNVYDGQGRLIPGDALAVKTVSGISQPLDSMCPFVYENAYSPHLAAKIEGNVFDMNTAVSAYEKLCGEYEAVVCEGSGGITCPLRFDGDKRILLDDFVQKCGLGCLLVADAGLGTINYVLLTHEYMKRKNIPLKGIIFNRYEKGSVLHEDNLYMCEKLTGVKVIACVGNGDKDIDIEAETLIKLYE